ncbi:MAG: hypothetical protein H0X33_13005 [Taibaiella sp.]|nr:hypothetical protein [Taibaiella sp.]
MNTTTIRQKLHNYLEVADDKKIKAMYTMMEVEIEEGITEYSNEFKAELEERSAGYKNGNEKTVTAAESRKRVQKIMKAGDKK